MLKNKRILVVLAHPDDETLGCGGLIHKYHEQFIHCTVPVERIKTQFLEAIGTLGVNNYNFGKFEDNRMDKAPLADICKFVEDAIAQTNAEVIITHHANCTNQDHRLLYQAVCIATRPVRYRIPVLTCEIPSSTGYLRPCGFEPNYYVSINNVDLVTKLVALNKYETEKRADRSPAVVSSLARLRGAESGTEYAEAFMLIRGFDET